MSKMQNIHFFPAQSPLNTITGDNESNTAFSIVSFNLLYKDWVNEDRYPFIKDDELRTWEYRLPRLRDTIASFKADIVCLQEVDVEPSTFKSDFGDYFRSKLGYESSLSPTKKVKEKKMAADGHWGNAVLFNPKRFKLIRSECIRKNAREMVLLFQDIQSERACPLCSDDSTMCCVYHCLFVVNVHLPGLDPKCYFSILLTLKLVSC